MAVDVSGNTSSITVECLIAIAEPNIANNKTHTNIAVILVKFDTDLHVIAVVPKVAEVEGIEATHIGESTA